MVGRVRPYKGRHQWEHKARAQESIRKTIFERLFIEEITVLERIYNNKK